MNNEKLIHKETDIPCAPYRKEMTDEQVEQVSSFMEKNITEDAKLMREVSAEEHEKAEITESDVDVFVNHNNGMITPLTEKDKPNFSDVSITEVADKMDNIQDIKIDEKQAETLKGYGLSDEDLLELTKIMIRVKSNEKFSVYNALPESVKKLVKGISPTQDLKTLQLVAKEFIQQFINDMAIDQAFVDFQESLKKELDIPDMTTMYSEFLRESMEEKLMDKAGSIQEAHPEKAATLRKISGAFTDSWHFNTIKEALKTTPGIRKALRKADIKSVTRAADYFNSKYVDNTFNIKDILLVPQVLERHLTPQQGYMYEDILRFTLLICEATKNMSPADIVEHTLMYYTVQNIMALEYVSIEKSEFNQMLLANIKQVIELIREKISK